jgi:hypothetical protein
MCADHAEGPAVAKAMPGSTCSPAMAALEVALSSMAMVIVTAVLDVGGVTGRVPRPVTK